MCAKLSFDKDMKAALVSDFSGGRCLSSKGLLAEEARDLLNHLGSLQLKDEAVERMRGKIMYYAHEMHWVKINEKGKRVADGARIDAWCLKYSYRKKKLNQYTREELPKLVSQVEALYKHFLNKL